MPQNETKSTWNNPTTIISLLTLLLSIGTNIFQFYNSKTQIEIVKEKSDAEIMSLKAQVRQWESKGEADADAIKRNEASNSAIKDELEEINNDIATWEQSVLKQTIELQEAQGDLDKAKNIGSNELIQINQEYLEKIKGTYEYSKSQLEGKKNRRKELENQLRQ